MQTAASGRRQATNQECLSSLSIIHFKNFFFFFFSSFLLPTFVVNFYINTLLSIFLLQEVFFVYLTAIMSNRQPAAKPPRIPTYLKTHESVNKLYRGLRNTKDNYLTDEQASDLGIEYSRLNLNDAEMAESESVRYFLPADPAKFNIAATGIKVDEFIKFPSSYFKELWGRFNCLVGAYLDYESALWDRNRPPSETIMYAHFYSSLGEVCFPF